MTGALWTGFSYRFDWQKFKETCVPDRKSVDKKNCRSDFDFHAEFSRNVTFYVEMSHFITKMLFFPFSCDLVPPGGFQSAQTYSQGWIRMPTAPGGSKVYSPARNLSYFNQKLSYFIQNWRIWTFESPQRLPDVGFAIPTSIFNTIPREWRSEFIFSVIF